MFEAAEIGHKLSKEEYRERVPDLRAELVALQARLRDADTKLVISLAGDDRIGCNELLARLFEWFDPRFLRTAAFGAPSEEERERPLFWRYWRVLPARGRIGIYLNGWASWTILEQFEKHDPLRLERRLRHVNGFERALVADGALVLKFWVHLPKGQHRKRLAAAEKNPEALWKVDEIDRQLYQEYDEVLPLVEEVLRLTSNGQASWEIVEGGNPRYRDVTVAEAVRDALSKHLDEAESRVDHPPATPSKSDPNRREVRTVLDTVDLSQTLPEDRYEKQLNRWQRRTAEAVRRASDEGISTVGVFQGWDAAGKGGAIRRLTAALPPSITRIVPIGAPSDEERGHHHLWRFWRRLPRAGRVVLFDRSWYERVLTERVEGFASPDEWGRAYDEINDFEEQLCEHGVVIQKFWLHIDPDEQMRRFEEREQSPAKQYKITEEDYRNRSRWKEYELAVDEMVRRTDTEHAPWHLVAANDKRFARIDVLKEFAKRLEDAL